MNGFNIRPFITPSFGLLDLYHHALLNIIPCALRNDGSSISILPFQTTKRHRTQCRQQTHSRRCRRRSRSVHSKSRRSYTRRHNPVPIQLWQPHSDTVNRRRCLPAHGRRCSQRTHPIPSWTANSRRFQHACQKHRYHVPILCHGPSLSRSTGYGCQPVSSVIQSLHFNDTNIHPQSQRTTNPPVRQQSYRLWKERRRH